MKLWLALALLLLACKSPSADGAAPAKRVAYDGAVQAAPSTMRPKAATSRIAKLEPMRELWAWAWANRTGEEHVGEGESPQPVYASRLVEDCLEDEAMCQPRFELLFVGNEVPTYLVTAGAVSAVATFRHDGTLAEAHLIWTGNGFCELEQPHFAWTETFAVKCHWSAGTGLNSDARYVVGTRPLTVTEDRDAEDAGLADSESGGQAMDTDDSTLVDSGGDGGRG